MVLAAVVRIYGDEMEKTVKGRQLGDCYAI